MSEYNLKHYAHLGDSVYEVFIREFVIQKTHNQKQMHDLTTKFVNANFQAETFNYTENFLTEEELEIARRARNLPITINKRNNPQIHRIATALEVLVGFWYLNDRKRLDEIFSIIKKNLKV